MRLLFGGDEEEGGMFSSSYSFVGGASEDLATMPLAF